MAGVFEMRASELETRAVAVLRSEPELAVPLARLHGRLAAELGRAAGTPAELLDRLRGRPDLFLLLDPPAQAWEVEPWSREARDEYRTALRQLGLDPGPRVALASVPEPTDPPMPAFGVEAVLWRLEASLRDLWSADPEDAGLQRDLIEAITQARELRDALGSAPHAVPDSAG